VSEAYHYVYGVVSSREATPCRLSGAETWADDERTPGSPSTPNPSSDHESEDGEPVLEAAGVHGAERLYPVSHGRVAAIASPIDDREPTETDEDARRHDAVLRALMFEGDGRTVVPMRFGMVFDSERALKNVLRGGRGAFRRALNGVEDQIELGVSLVRPPETSIQSGPLEETVSAELDPLATDYVENDRYSDRLLLNRSYLVPRAEQEQFDEAVAAVADTTDEVLVRYTGPYAPYSFVDIQVGASR